MMWVVSGFLASYRFPINRRHQGLATLLNELRFMVMAEEFPINRRHQGLATSSDAKTDPFAGVPGFPINRRHKGLATPLELRSLQIMIMVVSNQ